MLFINKHLYYKEGGGEMGFILDLTKWLLVKKVRERVNTQIHNLLIRNGYSFSKLYTVSIPNRESWA